MDASAIVLPPCACLTGGCVVNYRCMPTDKSPTTPTLRWRTEARHPSSGESRHAGCSQADRAAPPHRPPEPSWKQGGGSGNEHKHGSSLQHSTQIKIHRARTPDLIISGSSSGTEARPIAVRSNPGLVAPELPCHPGLRGREGVGVIHLTKQL